nr:ribonuclease H-like domain-containing protein [Tanacetum cinerariifolium]
MVQKLARNHAQRGHHQHYDRMTHPNPKRHVVLTAILTMSTLVLLTVVRPVTTAVSPNNVIKPRPAKTVVTKPYSPPRMNINRRPFPNPSTFPPKVTTVMAPKLMLLRMFKETRTRKLNFDDVYFVKELKFNLFSISQLCDKKNNVLFIDTECIVLSLEFKLPDENQVLLRVPRVNNMYNVDLKNIIPSGDLTCLFAKAKLDESNLWHRRLGHINFKTMNKLVKGNQSNPSAGVQEQFDAEKAGEDNVQQYVIFPLWYFGSKNPQNTDGDATFKVKEPDFEGRKHGSKVHVSPSSSAKTKKHDDKTKREAKGKKADFTNLETTITLSLIPTTRVHKDHPVIEIIGDLSSATQTRKPKRVHKALKDPSWIEAMQEEPLQFKMQKVWVLGDLPNGKIAIGRKEGSSKNTYSRLPGIGLSSRSVRDSKFSSTVIAMNSSNSTKSFSSRMVPSMEWRISLPTSRRASKSSSKISSNFEIELLLFDSNYCISSVKKRNDDCGTKSQSDDTVGSPHGFVIHGIEVLKGNEKVTEVIDVENWPVDNSRMLRSIVSLIE